MSRVLTSAAWGLMALLSLLVAALSFRYLAPSLPFVPPNIAENLLLKPWLVIHAAAAATALLTGPFQFAGALRRRFPRAHRLTGRIYVAACLLGGLSAFPVAWGASAGPIAQVGFFALAVGWIGATTQGWRLAVAGRIAEHQRWMVRSFAMAFSAVTLRLYLPVGPLMGFDFMEAYRVITWLSWVPNLILVELWMNRRVLVRAQRGVLGA